MAESARTTVYLDPQVFRALKVKAAASDRSLSEIVNEAALRALREDAVDLAAFDDRAGQPSRPFEQVLQFLKRDGLL